MTFSNPDLVIARDSLKYSVNCPTCWPKMLFIRSYAVTEPIEAKEARMQTTRSHFITYMENAYVVLDGRIRCRLAVFWRLLPSPLSKYLSLPEQSRGESLRWFEKWSSSFVPHAMGDWKEKAQYDDFINSTILIKAVEAARKTIQVRAWTSKSKVNMASSGVLGWMILIRN